MNSEEAAGACSSSAPSTLLHKEPLASKTSDRLAIFRIVRNVFGDEALDLIAAVRTAVEEWRHCFSPKRQSRTADILGGIDAARSPLL